MFVGYISWCYLLRRRINSIGVMGITVGVGALIMILSIMTGFLEESRDTVRGSLADVIIEPSSMGTLSGDPLPTSADPLLEAVRKEEGVVAASPRLSWGGLLIQGGRDTRESVHRLKNAQSSQFVFAHIVGVDVESEYETTNLREWLLNDSPTRVPIENVDDPFARPQGFDGDEPFAWVVVGEQLAEYRRLHQGSVINLITVVPDPRTGEVRENNRKFLVAGTFRSKDNEVDLSRIYVDRWELSDFLSDTHEFTQVLLKLDDYELRRETIDAQLTESLAGQGLLASPDPRFYEVRTWEGFRSSLLGAIENERVLMGIMLALIVLVAAFTVFAILMMMVTEKRRDIGILTALGATPTSIRTIFFMIGMWNALLGCLLGAIIGVLGALNIDGIERWLSATFEVQIFDRDVYMFDHIPAVVTPMGVISVVAGALLATAIFSFFPAWRASRLHPIDALRAE